MKNNIKNNALFNGEDKLNLESIKMRNSTTIQRVFDQPSSSVQLTTDYGIDSQNLSDAIMGKTVVKDEENNRVLGITDNTIIEFDDRIMKALTIASKNILKKFKEHIKNGTVSASNIAETLKRIEFTNAAFVATTEFQQVKKELNGILADMMNNGTPEIIEMVREGILGFFDASTNNIVRGRKKFKNVPYAIENSKEKEFLRAVFIGEMHEAGVFDYSFLEMSGEIDQMDFDIIDNIYRKSELFTPEQVQTALFTSGCFKSRDEILEYYLKNDKRYFVQFATSEEIASCIIAGKISPRDSMKKIRLDAVKDFSPELLEDFLCVPNFPKGVEFIDYIQVGSKTERFLSKKLLSKLDRERFLKVVLSEKIAETYVNSYTSENYINEYGKLNSSDMIYLEQVGKILEEDLIKLTSFKSMQVQDPNEYENMVNNLLAFYDLNRLENLFKSQKVNKKFVELYNDLIDNMATDEQRKLYFEKMNQDLEAKQNSDELITSLVITGLNVGESIDSEVSEDYIVEKYLEEELQEDDLMKLYENGLIPLNTIGILFSDSELIEKYRNGTMDYRVLNIIENRAEIIKTEFKSRKLNVQELLTLYSDPNGIVFDEFEEITEGYKFDDEVVVDYISDEITPEKVQALFNNYYISQDDLSVLVARNVITKEQAKEFAKKMSTHELYESIFSIDDKFIVLTRENQGEQGNGGRHIPRGEGHKRPGQIKNDPELQELLLSQIGFDERTLTLQGTNNSLDGYKVYPSEDYGVMVFLKNDKPGNATYIMSLQQGLFFLNKIVREKRNRVGETELGFGLQSDATKRELRETEHVKIRNASAGWGANIVDAIRKLSPEFKEKMREQSEYKQVIDDVIQEIREDYQTRIERD